MIISAGVCLYVKEKGLEVVHKKKKIRRKSKSAIEYPGMGENNHDFTRVFVSRNERRKGHGSVAHTDVVQHEKKKGEEGILYRNGSRHIPDLGGRSNG